MPIGIRDASFFSRGSLVRCHHYERRLRKATLGIGVWLLRRSVGLPRRRSNRYIGIRDSCRSISSSDHGSIGIRNSHPSNSSSDLGPSLNNRVSHPFECSRRAISGAFHERPNILLFSSVATDPSRGVVPCGRHSGYFFVFGKQV